MNWLINSEIHDLRNEGFKKDKWITAINDIVHIHSTFKDHSFVFVNMNNFKYPKYGTLRSGRPIVY